MVFSRRQQKIFYNDNVAHYVMHFFGNWTRQKDKNVLEESLEKEGFSAEITTELIFLDLVEYSSDL